MPTRQASQPNRLASASNSNETTRSTLRALVTERSPFAAGALSAAILCSDHETTGAPDPIRQRARPISDRTCHCLGSNGTSARGPGPPRARRTVRRSDQPAVSVGGDKSGLGHELLVQSLVLLQKLHHVRAGDERGLERLLLHVVLIFSCL